MASVPVINPVASEAPRAPLPRPEPPRFHSGKTFFWGIVLILAVGFLAWLIIGHYVDNFVDLDQQRVKERQEILAKRNVDDWHWLNDAPSYFDKEKGKIRVPLSEAVKLALPTLQSGKPHAAYPLTDSPPQPAAAPTSPDKGAGSPKDGNLNPSASNPTLAQPSPGATPAAGQAPTPVPPSTTATPPAGAPTPGSTPQVGTAATSTPTPPPAATNNALNPGNPPPNGAQPQPSPAPPGNTETTGAGSPTPSGAQPQALTSPASPPTASPENTPVPSPKEPGTP